MQVQRDRRAFIDKIFINRLAVNNSPGKARDVACVEIFETILAQHQSIKTDDKRKQVFVCHNLGDFL